VVALASHRALQGPQMTQFVLHHGLACSELFWGPIVLLGRAIGTLLLLAIRGVGHRTNHFLVCPFADRVAGSFVSTATTNDSSSLVSPVATAGWLLSRGGGRLSRSRFQRWEGPAAFAASPLGWPGSPNWPQLMVGSVPQKRGGREGLERTLTERVSCNEGGTPGLLRSACHQISDGVRCRGGC